MASARVLKCHGAIGRRSCDGCLQSPSIYSFWVLQQVQSPKKQGRQRLIEHQNYAFVLFIGSFSKANKIFEKI